MRHLLSLTALATALALAGPAEARRSKSHHSDDEFGREQPSKAQRGGGSNALQQDKFKPAWERKDPNAHLQATHNDPTRDPTVARFAKAMHDPRNRPGVEKEEKASSKHRGMKTIVVSP